MSVADDLQAFADLAETAAHQALAAQIGLGPRPSGPDTAVLLWDQTSTHLQGQIDSLTALAAKLSADAVITALADSANDVAQLEDVTDRATAAIKQINDLSKLLTTIGHVVDVGLAVLALSAAPTPVTAASLLQKIQTLAADVQGP
jgi:hypothetical protein